MHGCAQFFASLFPENPRLRAILKLSKQSASDIISYLRLYGDDLPGDLSVSSPDCLAKPVEMTQDLEAILTEGDALDDIGGRFFLAGAEPKAAVVFRYDPEGKPVFFQPSAALPSTHILKAAKWITFAEAGGTRLAAACGLPVAETVLLAIAGRDAIAVKRFDRKFGENGTVAKLRQEDFCQTLGKGSEEKYWQGSKNGISEMGFARVIIERLPAGAWLELTPGCRAVLAARLIRFKLNCGIY